MASTNAMIVPYGAFELKRSYQRNMLLGTGFAAALTILCVFTVWIYNLITYDEMDVKNVVRIKTIADLGAPPSLTTKPPQVNIEKPQVAAPKVGVPTPVADDEVADENMQIASREELQDINAPTISTEGQNSQLVIDIPADDYMPTPDEFVAHEVEPEMIFEKQPDYPPLALEGGFTAEVTVEALVGKDGIVKKAQAVKCTRPGMGFEEVTVKAALECKYKPAIQNGNPIAVWVTYTKKFRLENK